VAFSSEFIVVIFHSPHFRRQLLQFEIQRVDLHLHHLQFGSQRIFNLGVSCPHTLLLQLHQTMRDNLHFVAIMIQLFSLLLDSVMQRVDIRFVLPFNLLYPFQYVEVADRMRKPDLSQKRLLI
jgi:hypothetical protein